MDINVVRIATTLISLLIFILIVAWAMSPASAANFEAAARLPFEDDDSKGV